MAIARRALRPGYYLRAARHLHRIDGTVIIGTGFPVAGTFETDGPVGAMALYQALDALGARPVIACGEQLAQVLDADFCVLPLTARNLADAQAEADSHLARLQPRAIVAIECPGLAADGRYYNMRGDDISARCTLFDPFIGQAACPTLAIGDGGNEIGMGNISEVHRELDIRASVTRCDELLLADISNWGAYGLIALLALWAQRDLLADIAPAAALDYLCQRGGVDGVTGANTPTEDGLQVQEGRDVIAQLRQLTQFSTALPPSHSDRQRGNNGTLP
ncbi:MAG: DUF4392 domain-containing protein [Halioglobus sp.]|nr:DUF4392 domain-containing protein [Halioglobus sp.]